MFSSSETSVLDLDDVVSWLGNRTPFSYAKINHGLWERLALIELLQAQGVTDARELDRKSGTTYLIEGGFAQELAALLARIPTLRGAFHFGAGPYSWPACRRIEGTPAVGFRNVRETIDRFVPPAARTADPLLWKLAVHEGRIAEPIVALRSRDVTLVGPGWLGHFGDFAGLPRFDLHEIHSTQAKRDRVTLFEKLVSRHDPGRDPVYLVSAGSLSAWLIIRLHESLERATLLDFGEVLDLANISRLVKSNWALAWRAKVAKAVVAINPDWPEDPRAYEPGLTAQRRRSRWQILHQGVDPRVALAAGLPPRSGSAGELDRASLDAPHVAFVEAKNPDWARMAEIAEIAVRANRWANFGPVSQALENVIAALLDLTPERKVVAASSATSALFALVGLHSHKAGRPLRWLVSAYGFFSTAVGPLAECTRVVDCDAGGFLDLALVDELPSDQWDGMIVTNTFGLARDMGDYQRYCTAKGKELIVDSALAFIGHDRSSDRQPDEVVSFHHTKPWGFGEGGCAIVSSADADLVRGFLNFAVGTPAEHQRFGQNGKMSDLAAVAIIERLERLPSWAFFYRRQERRIVGLVRAAGLSMLRERRDLRVRPHVPVLAPGPIALDAVPAAPFDVRKYYRPLDPTAPRATELYQRIVCIPSHPGMAAVPTREIEQFLNELRNVAS